MMFWLYTIAAAINVFMLAMPGWDNGLWVLPVGSCALCLFGAYNHRGKK